MDYKLPEIGEGVQEGELIKWLVKDGDMVSVDQPLLEVMTDKATVEVPSPVAGKISGITAKEGQMIKVGQVLAQIAPSSAATKPAAKAPEAPVAKASPATAPSTNGNGHHTGYAAAPAPAPATSTSGGAYRGALESYVPETVPAAPIVRAMAQKSGVDLNSVPATGPMVGGRNRVLEEDLIKYLSGNSAAPRSAAATPTPTPYLTPQKLGIQFPTRTAGGTEEVERKPLRGLRRVISNAMVKSKFTAPHYSYVDEFECSSLVDLREQAKVIGEKMGVKITYLPFIVKAVVGALKQYPIVNSSLSDLPDGTQEIVTKKYYHIGVAVATPDGLVVPVIKNADQKSLLEIAHEIAVLSDKVKNGKATPDELKGSTFSITSMGNIGGLFATPILNYPEAGILGVYKVQEKPIVQNGQIVVGKTMHLSLSLDHRVVDGAVGGYFCNAIIERLQNPARLMLEMT